MEENIEEIKPTEKQKDYSYLYTPLAIIIAGFMISGTLFYASGAPTGPLGASIGDTAVAVSSPDTTPGDASLKGLTITDEDFVKGNPDAPITIVEFSDFQCPFCGRFHPTLQRVLDEYGDDVRWVYKHFPLDQIHSEARPAAEASECIAEQKGNEGFWEFGDALFASQSRLGQAFYQELAQQMGLDMNQFNTCVTQRKYQDEVEEDYQLGLQLGITGTPGSFINNVPVRGALPYSNIKSIIDGELAKLQ